MGVSQNTKHLTIRQIQKLIANNGVVENIDKAIAQKRPTEYCMTALQDALNERLERRSTKYMSSPEYITAQVNEALKAQAVTVFPPEMPKSFKANYKSGEKKSISKNSCRFNKFNFGAPLWQVEKLSLDERLNIFTKGA